MAARGANCADGAPPAGPRTLILLSFFVGIKFAMSNGEWATTTLGLARGVDDKLANATIWPLGRIAHTTPLEPTAVGQPMKRPTVTTCSLSSFQTLNPQGESSERQISCDRPETAAPGRGR
jgi:hypothetical protein